MITRGLLGSLEAGAGLLEVSKVNLLLTHPPATCISINLYHVLDLMQHDSDLGVLHPCR